MTTTVDDIVVPPQPTQSQINDQFIARVRDSVHFDVNWHPAIAILPVAIANLAKSNMYSSLPDAANVSLDRIDKNLFPLSTTLAGCFQDLVNACILAFSTAERNLNRINVIANDVFNTLSEDILPELEGLATNPTTEALQMIKVGIQSLTLSAKDSHAGVLEVASNFAKASSMIGELYRALREKSGIITGDALQAHINAIAKSQELTVTQQAVDTTKARVEALKGVLDTAQASFDKASKDYPSTMQVMQASIFMSLTDCATSIITQAVPALVANIGMANKIESGIKVADDTGLDIARNAEGKDARPDTSPQKTVNYAADPAYSLVHGDQGFITQLSNIITQGPGGGVEWDQVRPSKNAPQGGSEIKYLMNRLQDSRDSSTLTNDPPSVNLKGILDDALKVAKLVANGAASVEGKTGADSQAKIADWQANIKDVVARISQMSAESSALPGTGGATGLSATAAMNSTIDKSKVLLQGAADQLNITSTALQTSSANYSNAATDLAKVQLELAKVSAEVIQFDSQVHILNEALAILQLMAGTCADFQAKVQTLMLNFQALQTIVDSVVEHDGDRFISDVKIMATASGDDMNQGGAGRISLAGHAWYVGACTLAAYFDLFGDVCLFYVNISQKTITSGDETGGMFILNEAGKPFPFTSGSDTTRDTSGILTPAPVTTTGDDSGTTGTPRTRIPATDDPDKTGADHNPVIAAEMQKRLALIGKWQTDTTDILQQMIADDDAKIKDRMNKHLQNILKQMPQLPPSPQVVTGAQKGQQNVVTQVQERINETQMMTTQAHRGA